MDAKSANRKFYDIAADVYETVDGRRDPSLNRWLEEKLAGLAGKTGGGTVIDIGTGTGYLLRLCRGLFRTRVGTDLSPAILVKAVQTSELSGAAAAEVSALPFKTASADLVTCFAVLHHLPEFPGFFREAARILRPGGVFYSDHDMNKLFMNRYRPLMMIYRRIFDAAARYSSANPALTRELHDAAEVHANGIDPMYIERELRAAGFAEVSVKYHWRGLNRIANALFGGKGEGYSPKNAPLVTVTAVR